MSTLKQLDQIIKQAQQAKRKLKLKLKAKPAAKPKPKLKPKAKPKLTSKPKPKLTSKPKAKATPKPKATPKQNIRLIAKRITNELTGRKINREQVMGKDGKMRKKYENYRVVNNQLKLNIDLFSLNTTTLTANEVAFLFKDEKEAAVRQKNKLNLTDQAFKNKTQRFKIDNVNRMKGMKGFNLAKSSIPVIKARVKQFKQVKFSLGVDADFRKAVYGKVKGRLVKSYEHQSFNKVLKGITVNSQTDLSSLLSDLGPEVQNFIDLMQQKDTGWTFEQFSSFTATISHVTSAKGSSYMPLPEWMAKKRAVINMQNEDNRCLSMQWQKACSSGRETETGSLMN